MHASHIGPSAVSPRAISEARSLFHSAIADTGDLREYPGEQREQALRDIATTCVDQALHFLTYEQQAEVCYMLVAEVL